MKKDNYLDLDFTDHIMNFQVSRRDFLKIAGGGIFIFMTIGNIPANADTGKLIVILCILGQDFGWIPFLVFGKA